MTSQTAVASIAIHIQQHGPIPAARVSSAQAKGAAKGYAYWGAVRYVVDLSRDGRVIVRATERATSDRRSRRLAHLDMLDLCARESRIQIDGLTVDDAAALDILSQACGQRAVPMMVACVVCPVGAGLL